MARWCRHDGNIWAGKLVEGCAPFRVLVVGIVSCGPSSYVSAATSDAGLDAEHDAGARKTNCADMSFALEMWQFYVSGHSARLGCGCV